VLHHSFWQLFLEPVFCLDVPGHQIRIFELRRTLPDDQPNCES
jgi:hypothetical protein